MITPLYACATVGAPYLLTCKTKTRVPAVTGNTWVSGTAPHCHWVYSAKTRYRQKDAPCSIASIQDGRCEIEFAEPQWAVTPGQSVVIYESRVCLGGGIIE